MTVPVLTSGSLNDLGLRVLAYTHPIYTTWAPEWIKLAHVREGAGGFLDGSYILAHPREWEDFNATTPKKPTKKLKARRAIACYENFAATIIDIKKSALFREGVTRRVGTDTTAAPSAIELWWEDVDGHGTSLSDFLKMAWDCAATFGHVFIYLEKPGTETGDVALTAADERQPQLSLYTPLDVNDWLEDDDGNLVGVKMTEGVPRSSFTQLAIPLARIRTVDETGWTLYDRTSTQATIVSSGQHDMGRLPIAVLYAQRRTLLPRIGQSVLGQAAQHVDLYNLLSEARELLRNQAFSVLNIELGTGDQAMSVEAAKTLISETTGTQNVLFSGGKAQYITAPSTNIEVYQDEIERRLRTIYRLAAIHWDSDKRGVESSGSVVIKREDMNQRLASYADELEQTEYAIAELWYRATYGADLGPVKMAQDQITIRYPDTFDVTPFDVILQQAQAAISLGMPTAVMKEIRKSLVNKFLPELTDEKLADMLAAIDAMASDLTPQDQLKMKLEATTKAFGGGLPNQSEPKPAPGSVPTVGGKAA